MSVLVSKLNLLSEFENFKVVILSNKKSKVIEYCTEERKSLKGILIFEGMRK